MTEAEGDLLILIRIPPRNQIFNISGIQGELKGGKKRLFIYTCNQFSPTYPASTGKHKLIFTQTSVKASLSLLIILLGGILLPENCIL